MKNIEKVAIAAALALSLSTLGSGQTVFSKKKVPGSSSNSLTAINNAGQVVANDVTPDSRDISIWSRLSGTQDLGMQSTNGIGVAINNPGSVIGSGLEGSSGVLQAFIWEQSGNVQWLGSLGGKLSEASGVNDSGAVVGLSYTASLSQHAFLWTAAEGMQDLTPNLTSIGGATAMGVNSSNEVVGYYFPNGSEIPIGFSWTQADGLQNIGPAGTLPFGINNSGTIVGRAPNASGFMHAFVWTPSGGMQDIGTLGGDESTAYSVNNLGWVVGTSITTTGGLIHAFLWTPTSGMQDFTVLGGLATGQQPQSVQVNDYGVVAISTGQGASILVPTITGTFSSSQNPSTLGQPVTFTATLTSLAGPPPDGEAVQFIVGGQVLGSGTLKGGVAQFTTSAINAGSHAVIANYVGDANYLPTKYQALTQVVNQ